MKFAIINDIHIGPASSGYSKGVKRKLTSKAEKLVEGFVKKMNLEEKPEFVVNLGDSIEDVKDRAADIKSFKKALALFSSLEMPVHHLIGNHDIRTISKEEIAKMIGIDQMHYSFDHGTYHFVMLSFEMTGDHTRVTSDIRAEISQEEIKWLKNDLQMTNKPCVVFIHYGLAEDEMKGNFWFEGEPQHALLGNREEVRQIFENSGKVQAVFSAHQHWNSMHVHKHIPYFVVTSLVENFRNDGVPSEAYTMVELDENRINVDVKGNDPAKYSFDFD